MNNRYILILSLLISIIMSISAVSAVDMDVNATDGINYQVLTINQNMDSDYSISNDVNNLNTCSSIQDNNILQSDGDTGSFSDLQKLIDEDTTGVIILDKNYSYDSSYDSDDGIVISKYISIDGSGKYVLNAKNEARIFKIIDGDNIVLNGITFVNANVESNGGSIFWAGTDGGILKILDSTFTNSSATGDGGSIFAGGYIQINNSIFTNSSGRYGGSISGSDMVITDSKFINSTSLTSGGSIYSDSNIFKLNNINITGCHAGDNGGAISIKYDSGNDQIVTDVSLYNILITNNSALTEGGAILIDGPESKLINITIDGCSVDYGGGIFFRDVILKLINLTFINNHANVDGGSIYYNPLYGDILTYDEGLTNVKFINNSADGNGGAVYLYADIGKIKDSVFINNTVGTNGGALDWHKSANDGSISNSVFINNTAKCSGGAVYWSGTNGIISNSTFKYNHNVGNVTTHDKGIVDYTTSCGNGGAVVWMGSLGLVDNCTFVSNTASARRGSIYLQDNHNTTVQFSEFVENVAGTNGGAVDWYKGSSDGRVLNSIFERNVAKRSAGAIYWYGHNGLVVNSNFTNNSTLGLSESEDSYGVITTGGDGGAIIWAGSLGTVSNSRFVNNSAPYRGGAVFLQGGSVEDCLNTSFLDSYFESNHAGLNGGAVDWSKGAHYGLVDNFVEKYADRSAGAIYWSGTDGVVVNSTFGDNYALGIVSEDDRGVTNYTTFGGDGGAVVWRVLIGLIHNTFYNNSAMARGGAIYLQNNENTTLQYSNFTSNTAGISGGAIDWNIGAINGNIKDSNFEDNLANINGGAINFNEGTINGIIVYSNFTNNIAKRNGGAIFWNGENGNVSWSNFNNNRATGESKEYTLTVNMGNIEVVTELPEASDLTMDKLFILDKSSTVDHVWFESRVTVKIGDEYEWLVLDELEINDASPSSMDWGIDQFFGGDGGSILWSGNVGIIDNCIFVDSNSARRGGGAYMTGGNNITVSNSIFVNCTYGTNGGALDWLAGANYGKIINSQFIGNRAARSAGTIYYDGDYGELYNVTISNSYAYGGSLKSSLDGGALFVTEDYIDIIDSNFTDSISKQSDGGAIYIICQNTTLMNSVIINSSARKGGVIYIEGIYVSIINSTLANSFAKSGNNYVNTNLCGSIYIKCNYANIFGSEFLNSSAYQGGVIYLEGSYCNISNSSFTQSYAFHDGGAMYSIGSHFNVLYSNFTFNEADYGGGAIYWCGGTNSQYNSIIGSIFTGNVAYAKGNPSNTLGGGGIYWSQGGSYGVIKDSQFYNNSVHSDQKADGGVILWNRSYNGLLDNCTFDGNYVTSTLDSVQWVQGGALFLRTRSNFTISNCVFKNSYSFSEAGALYLANENLISPIDILVINTSFIGNSVKSICLNTNGGGAVQIKECSNVRFVNVTFINNTVNTGGAISIFNIRTNIQLYNCTFIGNEATDSNGDAIAANREFHLYNAEFVNNTAINYGGALYTNSQLYYNNLTFINNSAYLGGGLYWSRGNSQIQNIVFINNTAIMVVLFMFQQVVLHF